MMPPLSRLSASEHRTIVPPKKPLGHMQPVVQVDANQMCVERGVMDFGERDAVRNHRLAKLLFSVSDDMSRTSNRGSGRPDSAQRPL